MAGEGFGNKRCAVWLAELLGATRVTAAPAGRVGGDAHMAFSSLTSGPRQRGKLSLKKDQEVLAQFYQQVTLISAWPQTKAAAFALLVTLFLLC